MDDDHRTDSAGPAVESHGAAAQRALTEHGAAAQRALTEHGGAAQRALTEAEQRHAAMKRAEHARPREIDGRQGPEPVRYGDWENKGIACDF